METASRSDTGAEILAGSALLPGPEPLNATLCWGQEALSPLLLVHTTSTVGLHTQTLGCLLTALRLSFPREPPSSHATLGSVQKNERNNTSIRSS